MKEEEEEEERKKKEEEEEERRKKIIDSFSGAISLLMPGGKVIAKKGLFKKNYQNLRPLP